MSASAIAALPPGSRIKHYRILHVLGGGGFSIVYLAEDLKNGEQVALKEYFPAKLARRENGRLMAKDDKSVRMFKLGRQLFFQEAALLAAIDHSNIVDVRGFCHSHGTVYIAMRHEQGCNLQTHLKMLGRPLEEQEIRDLFLPLLDAIGLLHRQDLLHLDIKPANIYLRDNGEPLLLDFGAVHKLLRSSPPRLFPVVSHGYSPPEQSFRHAELGPWTDLYAIGASIRTCISGKPPPSAKKRRQKPLKRARLCFGGRYSARLLDAIDWCMRLPPHKRPQRVEDLLAALDPLRARKRA